MYRYQNKLVWRIYLRPIIFTVLAIKIKLLDTYIGFVNAGKLTLRTTAFLYGKDSLNFNDNFHLKSKADKSFIVYMSRRDLFFDT